MFLCEISFHSLKVSVKITFSDWGLTCFPKIKIWILLAVRLSNRLLLFLKEYRRIIKGHCSHINIYFSENRTFIFNILFAYESDLKGDNFIFIFIDILLISNIVYWLKCLSTKCSFGHNSLLLPSNYIHITLSQYLFLKHSNIFTNVFLSSMHILIGQDS